MNISIDEDDTVKAVGLTFVNPGPIRRFIGYRPQAAELGKHGPGQLAPPDQPQYCGVVFPDGSVACRWLTEYRSISTWDNLDAFIRVHGHPEYGTVIVWLDYKPAGVDAVFDELRAEYAERMAAQADIETGNGPVPS
jgi:hypothetical protein